MRARAAYIDAARTIAQQVYEFPGGREFSSVSSRCFTVVAFGAPLRRTSTVRLRPHPARQSTLDKPRVQRRWRVVELRGLVQSCPLRRQQRLPSLAAQRRPTPRPGRGPGAPARGRVDPVRRLATAHRWRKARRRGAGGGMRREWIRLHGRPRQRHRHQRRRNERRRHVGASQVGVALRGSEARWHVAAGDVARGSAQGMRSDEMVCAAARASRSTRARRAVGRWARLWPWRWRQPLGARRRDR